MKKLSFDLAGSLKKYPVKGFKIVSKTLKLADEYETKKRVKKFTRRVATVREA